MTESPTPPFAGPRKTMYATAQRTGQRVCVIGAGVAGLAAAKVLRGDGFEATVFDREPTIGGVWAASRAYPGLRANSPRETYAFSEFPSRREPMRDVLRLRRKEDRMQPATGVEGR